MVSPEQRQKVYRPKGVYGFLRPIRDLGAVFVAKSLKKWRARNVRIAIRAPFLAFADVRHINEINRMMFLGDRPSPQKYASSAVLA
jgi:hypothetical protein